MDNFTTASKMVKASKRVIDSIGIIVYIYGLTSSYPKKGFVFYYGKGLSIVNTVDSSYSLERVQNICSTAFNIQFVL